MSMQLGGMRCNVVVDGCVAVIVGSPVDVLKTRLMNLSGGESGLAMVTGMVKNEGLGSFYKGFSANFMRLGAWNCCMFVSLE